VNAELVRIEPLKEHNIAIGGMKAFLAKQAPIKPCKTDLAGIDTLIIATPVWSGKVPPYVNEYLSAVTDGEGKPFHVIAEMGECRYDNPSMRFHLKAITSLIQISLIGIQLHFHYDGKCLPIPEYPFRPDILFLDFRLPLNSPTHMHLGTLPGPFPFERWVSFHSEVFLISDLSVF